MECNVFSFLSPYIATGWFNHSAYSITTVVECYATDKTVYILAFPRTFRCHGLLLLQLHSDGLARLCLFGHCVSHETSWMRHALSSGILRVIPD
ncbi:hypothetical protein G7K_0647-t1 [Saitoella complicata NRRL Y-17804]|uniref:Uncharacterized protein n=1 Tax=Saitoella complicata (strain BCRC 22490 / CBS 7301 / JCM 7358 / NBRC 10748 / NRRL Y-17804) TaxID=698492 RepID=A0A0E9N9P0_SAICN|nr:hypothetical protein G7K_0647-t1 [Saitoella complicata NRRL Y-17804]